MLCSPYVHLAGLYNSPCCKQLHYSERNKEKRTEAKMLQSLLQQRPRSKLWSSCRGRLTLSLLPEHSTIPPPGILRKGIELSLQKPFLRIISIREIFKEGSNVGDETPSYISHRSPDEEGCWGPAICTRAQEGEAARISTSCPDFLMHKDRSDPGKGRW